MAPSAVAAILLQRCCRNYCMGLHTLRSFLSCREHFWKVLLSTTDRRAFILDCVSQSVSVSSSKLRSLDISHVAQTDLVVCPTAFVFTFGISRTALYDCRRAVLNNRYAHLHRFSFFFLLAVHFSDTPIPRLPRDLITVIILHFSGSTTDETAQLAVASISLSRLSCFLKLSQHLESLRFTLTLNDKFSISQAIGSGLLGLSSMLPGLLSALPRWHHQTTFETTLPFIGQNYERDLIPPI